MTSELAEGALGRKLEELRAEMDTFDGRLADVTRTASELAHHQRSLRSALLAAMDELDRIDPAGAPPPQPAGGDPALPAVTYPPPRPRRR